MAGPYVVGNVIRLKGIWTDPNNNNALVDPTTVSIKYVDPNGLVTTVAIPGGGGVKEGVGLYHLDVLVSVAGTWWYDGISTGTAQARAENSFIVLATKVP